MFATHKVSLEYKTREVWLVETWVFPGGSTSMDLTGYITKVTTVTRIRNLFFCSILVP